MPASFLPYASKSNKIRCWDDSNWNLQLLITLVGLWTNIYLPSWTPPLMLPKEGKGVWRCPWKQGFIRLLWDMLGRETRRMEPSVHMCAHFAFPSFAGWCKKRRTTVGAAALANWPKYPRHLHSPTAQPGWEHLLYWKAAIRMDFLKFPFLSENERKMLF